jgi:hypothetical protein
VSEKRLCELIEEARRKMTPQELEGSTGRDYHGELRAGGAEKPATPKT